MYRNAAVFVVSFIALATVAAAAVGTVQQDASLLDNVLDRCTPGPGAVQCLKTNVLEYLNGGRSGRSVATATATADLDTELTRATTEYMERQVMQQRDGRATDGEQSPAMEQQQQQQQQQPTTTTTARADAEMGMMQDKMFMPLMMMLKLKLKMLMPIMMAVISMKATKALVLSKVAIMLVLGFLLKEFLKKSGIPSILPLHLPGLPGGPEPSTTAMPSPPMYGPPQSSGYESSSSWEPTGYSSHSSDNSHSMAYSSYLPSSSSSSSSGSSASLSASKYS